MYLRLPVKSSAPVLALVALAATALVTLLAPRTAQATIINFSETTDLSGTADYSSPADFVLDMAGTHTWTGSSLLNAMNDGTSQSITNQDRDWFSFSLGSNIDIVDFSFSVISSAFRGYSLLGAGANIYKDQTLFSSQVYRSSSLITSAGGNESLEILPQNDSTAVYGVQNTWSTFSCQLAVCRGSWEWQIQITTVDTSAAPMPLPPTAALFLLGLAGVISLRSRA